MKIAIPSPSRANGGFGLVELLMVVSVIGIFTGIVMPWFSGAERAAQAKDQRNAQTFCSLCTAAEAAGLNLLIISGSKESALEALVQGVTIPSGPLRGRTLRVPNMQPEDISGAAQYLKVQGGQLVYHSTGA